MKLRFEPPIYFIHLLKAGGTAVNAWLKSLYKSKQHIDLTLPNVAALTPGNNNGRDINDAAFGTTRLLRDCAPSNAASKPFCAHDDPTAKHLSTSAPIGKCSNHSG